MLATLGIFVFQLKTAPFEKLARSSSWRWASQNRVGQRPAYQHVGPGEDTITLTGSLVPELTGGRATLDALRLMADSGKAWPFIDGEGHIYGLWFIASMQETRSVLFKDGAARKIDFSLTLKKADDSKVEQIGSLARIGLGLLQ